MHDQKVWLDSLQRERTISQKDWKTAFVLSIFLGIVGADRFYVGRFDLGALKLLTFGGYFIWWMIDIVLLYRGRMKDGSGKAVKR